VNNGRGGEPKNSPPFTTPVQTLPGTATQPGFTPDYQGLIQNDPGFQALQQAISAAGIQNASQRASATQRALIQFGLVPDLHSAASKLGLGDQALGFLSQDVTPDVSALANANTANGLSTEAQLQQAHQQQVLHLRNALAARGGLSSGEANYQLGNEQTSYGQAQQSAIGKLLDAISGYQSQYLTGEQASQQQLAQGLGAAQSRQQALPQNQPTDAQTYHYDPGTGKYVGSGGTFTPRDTGNGHILVNDATGQAHALNPDGTIGSTVNAADYFAAHPLAQGTSTDAALQALSQFSANPTAVYTPGSVPAQTAAPAATPARSGPTRTSGFTRVPLQ
jgi:hypothetical protein